MAVAASCQMQGRGKDIWAGVLGPSQGRAGQFFFLCNRCCLFFCDEPLREEEKEVEKNEKEENNQHEATGKRQHKTRIPPGQLFSCLKKKKKGKIRRDRPASFPCLRLFKFHALFLGRADSSLNSTCPQ